MIISIANIRKTINYFKKNGFKNTYYAALERILEKRGPKYIYNAPSAEELEAQANTHFPYEPRISIIVPAYETEPVYIEDLVLAMEEQSYGKFELIIADASTTNRVQNMVTSLMDQYDRIVYKRLEKNDGISSNSNEALKKATGDYVGLLDHDDLLTPDALFSMVECINANIANGIEPVLIYSDEDKTDAYLDRFYDVNEKPAFNEELLLTNNYICHFCVYKREVITKLEFRKEYDGAQDYDLELRTVLFCKNEYKDEFRAYIKNVPKVLYHWRCHENSTAENPASKMYAYEAGRRAVQDYLDAQGIKAEVKMLKHLGFYRVCYEDIFESRNEIAAIGGPIYKDGVIASGALDAKGNVIYKGLRKEFSGKMHRAVLMQEVRGLDIRNIKVRPQYQAMLDEVLSSISSSDSEKTDEMIFLKKSFAFCNKLRKLNIVLLYDPEMDEE